MIARHINYVRKNASWGGNKVTLPRCVFEAPAFGGGFFLSLGSELADGLSPRAAKTKGPPSRWKDSLVCSFEQRFCITSGTRETGLKLAAGSALVPLALGVGSLSPDAPQSVRGERRLAWWTFACSPKN